MTTLREVRLRRIPKLIFGPFHVDAAYAKADQFYQWFRKGDNRFSANGIHGHSGHILFHAYDRGDKHLPYDEYRQAYLSDAAQHTKRRFASRVLVSRPRNNCTPSDGENNGSSYQQLRDQALRRSVSAHQTKRD